MSNQENTQHTPQEFGSIEELKKDIGENAERVKSIEEIRREQEAIDAAEEKDVMAELDNLLGTGPATTVTTEAELDLSFLDTPAQEPKVVEEVAEQPVALNVEPITTPVEAFVSDLEKTSKAREQAQRIVAATTETPVEPTVEPVKTEVKVPKAKVEQSTETTNVDSVKRKVGNDDFQVTVAQEAQEAKKKGDLVETMNVLVDAMRELNQTVGVSNEKSEKIRDILANAKFDVDDIDIDEDTGTDPLSVHQQLTILQSARPDPVFPMIALKSGYKAEMSALTNADKISISNLVGSPLDQITKVLRLVHSKIRTTSVGPLKYERWLEITAEEDYDSLIYGIFTATFPQAIDYTVTCPYCETKNTLPLEPRHLVEVIDQERANNYVQEVLAGYNRGEEFLRESLVAQTKRIRLPQTAIVIDLRTPTLKDMLHIASIVDKFRNFPPEIVQYIKFIKGFYAPKVQSLHAGKPSFIAIKEVGKQLNMINDFTAEDMKFFRKEISDRVQKFHVTYAIPKFTCASAECHKEVASTPVDMVSMLFLGLREEQSV